MDKLSLHHHRESSVLKNSSKLFLKILTFFLGIGSLIWFFVRVIPKPSRAAYPCMRVAAPIASTFVLWLTGLFSSLLFINKAREHIRCSRYMTAAACLIIGGIIGGIFISTPHSPAFAKIKSNSPVGDAKGANPGRVVWVYDSSVSDWNGLGDGHWWEGNHTRQPIVDQMFSRSLRELSGKANDSAAWDTLFRYFNKVHGRGSAAYVPGEKIAIKINLTFCNYFPEYTCVDSMNYHLVKKLDYMNTSPQAVRALLRQLVYVVGVNQEDISIGDPVAYYPHEYYDSIHAEFPNVRYVDHAGKFGRTKVEPSDIPVYWSCRPAGVKQDYVPEHYAEATYLINLANMKSHLGAGITLCAKNHYGSLRLPTDSGYYNLHESLAYMKHEMGNYRALVDIMGHAHLGGKTLLYLIDGLYAGNHNNDTVPHKWPASPFKGGWTSSLFASQDPVAIESVLFDIFQLDDNSYQYHKIEGAQDYLIEACQANNPPSGTFYDPNHATGTERLQSLGVMEHWNNSTDRKYSRNLSSGNGIELVFISGAASHTRNKNSRITEIPEFSIRALPKSSTIEFSTRKPEIVTLKLFDCQGRVLRSVSYKSRVSGIHRIDLISAASDKVLAPGSYIVALYTKSNHLAARCSFDLAGK